MLKRTVISLLLCASVISQLQPAPAAQAARFPAGFELPPQVKARPTPADGHLDVSPVCAGVWKGAASLCSPERLEQFVQLGSSFLQAEVGKVAQELQQVSQKAGHIAAAAAATAHRGLARRRLQVTPTSAEDAAVLTQVVDHLKDPTALQQFAASMGTCLGYLKTARSAALCYICSKDNAKHFTARKAVISSSDCLAMLDQCNPFLEASTGMLKNAGQLAEVLNKQQKNSNWHRAGQNILLMQQLLDKAQLPDLIATRQTAQTQDLRDAAGRQICARTFRVYKDRLFLALEVMATDLNMLLTAVAAGHSGSNGLRRLLQSALNLGQIGDPFVGDVSVLNPSDNMFTSYDGIRGSSLANTEGFQAMNLTNINA